MAEGREPVNATVVCVLGMHRSGTSVLTRVLNLLGVHLGPPDGLMRPVPDDNEEGFWEHTGFFEVNERILARFGGSWDRPPAFPLGWERSEIVADLRERATDLIRADFAETAMWGWKDPRSCLTLPFWQTLLPPMRYVVCLRNPLSVARSLQRRDGMPIGKGGNLWLLHVTSALAHTEGHTRLIASYERLLAEPEREARRIAEFIGRPEAFAGDVKRVIGETIRQDLSHHHGSLRETLGDRELPFTARALYAMLCLAGSDSGEDASGGGREGGTLVAMARAAGEEQAERDRLREAERRLEAITGGGAWALVRVLGRVRLALAPRGTRRERILGLGMRAVRLRHSR
jgi:hypothetical protein